MPSMARILLDLFIIFVAAKLAAELFERLRQPAVIGELVAGIAIGPFALGLIGRPDPALVTAFHDAATAAEALRLVYEVLAQLGVIVLLFFVGLETRLDDLLSVGRRAAMVGTAGIVLPFVLGYLLITSLGYSGTSAVFIGAAMVATSVGITARVLADLGALGRPEARIILGAAVIDDILGMILLAVVSGGTSGDGVSYQQIAVLAVEALGFTGFVVLVGRGIVRRFDARLEAPRVRNSALTVAIAGCLGLAALAGYVGLAAIIGAFLAGLVFSEARQREELIAGVVPIYDFLVPFFFVITGAQVDLSHLLSPGPLGLALAVTGLAVAGKLVGCSIGALGMGWRPLAVVGVGMVPRGEVGLIVAAIGRSLGVLSAELFSAVVLMSVVTTLIVPPVLNALYRSDQSNAAQ